MPFVRSKSVPPPLSKDAALFLDVDGTLLDISPRPELVRVPLEAPALLERLARQRDGALALVSGRPLVDLDRLFSPWRGAAAGIHGAERRRADGSLVGDEKSGDGRAAAAALDDLRPCLRELARCRPGLFVEDKGLTVAVHYRAIPEQQDEIRDILQQYASANADTLRLMPGKMVFELMPKFHGKGAAIAAFMGEPPFLGRMPVFVGDDITDEDGFAEVNMRGGLSIRVGTPDKATDAMCILPSVTAVLDWLRAN